jgi:hypothetical protein
MRKIFFARAALSPPGDQLRSLPDQPTAVRVEGQRGEFVTFRTG